MGFRDAGQVKAVHGTQDLGVSLKQRPAGKIATHRGRERGSYAQKSYSQQEDGDMFGSQVL